MKDGLIKINAYNRLINEIETIRRRQFSFDNAQDSNILFDYWRALQGPDKMIEPISKRWTDIGFQGFIFVEN